MKHPDLEVVDMRRDESFKAWSHGYPYHTVRWHSHPEYELHLILVTSGKYFVGDFVGTFVPGNLVLVGPNVPHNWISDVPDDQFVEQRSLVIQFSQGFAANCIKAFPEWREAETVLKESGRGTLFDPATSAAVRPIATALVDAHGLHRLTLFMILLERLCAAGERKLLVSPAYHVDPASLPSTRIVHALDYVAKNLTEDIREADVAQLTGQSVSAFSRSFRRHAGLPFVQYVNRMRIELACQLLSDDEPSITNICFQSGYKNVSNFNRQFRATKGMSPSEFRIWQRLNATTGASASDSLSASMPAGLANRPPGGPPFTSSRFGAGIN